MLLIPVHLSSVLHPVCFSLLLHPVFLSLDYPLIDYIINLIFPSGIIKASSTNSHIFTIHIFFFFIVVALTETWLSDRILDTKILPAHFTIYRKGHSSKVSGVLLAIDHWISSTPLPSPASLEILTVQISSFISHNTLTICVVYIPPSSCCSQYFKLLQYLSTIIANCPIIILGDLDLPMQR